VLALVAATSSPARAHAAGEVAGLVAALVGPAAPRI
jgi:hypothetical protein